MSTLINKDTRIDLRVESTLKEFLLYAAGLKHQKLSAFIVESAAKAAEEVVMEKANFFLSDKKWDQFCSALDKPARKIPELHKLITEPGVFDD